MALINFCGASGFVYQFPFLLPNFFGMFKKKRELTSCY